MQADGIAAGKILLGEAFVNHHRRGAEIISVGAMFDLLRIAKRKITAAHDRNAKRCKIVRADGIHVRLRALARFRSVTFHRHRAVPFVSFKDANGCQTDRENAWSRFQLLRQLLIKGLTAFVPIIIERRIDVETDQVFRRKARAEIAKIRQRSQKQSGSNQQ